MDSAIVRTLPLASNVSHGIHIAPRRYELPGKVLDDAVGDDSLKELTSVVQQANGSICR